jgi:hypothetical protein
VTGGKCYHVQQILSHPKYNKESKVLDVRIAEKI